MASSANRNGNHKVSFKPQPPGSLRSSSFKSRPSSGSTARRSSPASLGALKDHHDGVPGRVRVAVRLRPRNSEELVADADFADCVELQPEVKRLKLRKNNWDSDTYEFDEVLTEYASQKRVYEVVAKPVVETLPTTGLATTSYTYEFDEVLTEYASQKRVYEVVAKPVVESVLDGYNGTIMAYGQTGTGKTFTLGRLGDEDTSDRGIMVRAMEDILADVSPESDSITLSYLQLYMEAIQDLLDPTNDNIPIVEDPKTGDVSLPGATHVEISDQHSFLELLRIGEAHRIAANTKLNTESSRSHAILMVHVRRCVAGEDASASENGNTSHLVKPLKPLVRKSKLVIVDLAGSERIQKSGSEGHTLEEAKSINLSLSALGKCINALAEGSSHVPVRDSKLTRLLKDSFGGTARTSLVVTIGPSPRHRGETSSTILFGQRAMKVENMLKIKEEFDYKSLSRKLEVQLDKLIAENERLQKAFEDEIDKINTESQIRISDVERNFADALEKERLKCQMDYMKTIKELEEKMVSNQRLADEKRINEGRNASVAVEVAELKTLLNNEITRRKAAENEVDNLRSQLVRYRQPEADGDAQVLQLQINLEEEARLRKKLEEEVILLQNQLLQINLEPDQTRRYMERGGSGDSFAGLNSQMAPNRNPQPRENGHGQKPSIASLSEQVGLHKILSLLESEDPNVRIHAVKVVANLAAEEVNQERIVEAGGLTSLLMLLRRFDDETVRRVAAGAIANLAMNEANQELIMVQGGISLLSMTATNAEDPQTLRMVAGAIANLCGNDKLQVKLRSEGGIRALLGTVRCGHPDVLSQVARGIANFAKCESRLASQGIRSGRSLLIEDGALPWIVHNANDEAAPIRRHIELALCHLAQHEVNAKDMVSGGALWELVRISRDCTREDIRNLARKTLSSSPTFRAELRRLRVDY